MTYAQAETIRLESTESPVETAYLDNLFENLCLDMQETHLDRLIDDGMLIDEAWERIETMARAEYNARLQP